MAELGRLVSVCDQPQPPGNCDLLLKAAQADVHTKNETVVKDEALLKEADSVLDSDDTKRTEVRRPALLLCRGLCLTVYRRSVPRAGYLRVRCGSETPRGSYLDCAGLHRGAWFAGGKGVGGVEKLFRQVRGRWVL